MNGTMLDGIGLCLLLRLGLLEGDLVRRLPVNVRHY
jgi:hypothetical protein